MKVSLIIFVRGHENINVEMEYIDYYGPIYEYGTNTQVTFKDTRRLIDSIELEKTRAISNQRG